MSFFTNVVTICSGITTILALVVILIKPIRERVLGLHDIRDGLKCLLRSDMLKMYYKHLKDETIRQYEYENFMHDYAAYKVMGGNSFIEHIKNEVGSWSVVP